MLTKRKRSGKMSNVAVETQKQQGLRDTACQGITKDDPGTESKK